MMIFGLAVRVFANSPGDLGSIPGRVIPKTQKMVLDASLLNTLHYKVRIKGKVEQSWEGLALSPTPWCSSYRKGSLWVTLDYGRQLYFFLVIHYEDISNAFSCLFRQENALLISSSCHAGSRNLPDPLSPPVSIVHRSQEVFQATSCIGRELLYIGSS